MRLYLNRNIAAYGLRDSSKGVRLTHYVEGLGPDVFDSITDWQNDIVSNFLQHEKFGNKGLQMLGLSLVQSVHEQDIKQQDAFHCFIGIHNNHAVIYFIPIETKETLYNSTQWYMFSNSFPTDCLRVHLAFSEEKADIYAVYVEYITRQFEDYHLFLCCNIMTSIRALQHLAYLVALLIGNYRQLDSDCLEFTKLCAVLAKDVFATENEIRRCRSDIRMHIYDPGLMNALTVTRFKSEALSRNRTASKYTGLSLLMPLQTPFIAHILVSVLTTTVVLLIYHVLFK